ncbi:MAG: rhodanese-like domain-containing protein [Saprospiraceae bacterium]|nr:rhodanese-like domain-containing protein [Saprospiraceae bacterium]
MIKKIVIQVYCLVLIGACEAQNPDQRLTLNPGFSETIESYLDFSVPILTCEELYKNREHYLVLDAREREEFEISHLKDAVFVGYKEFDYSTVADVAKTRPIVVYCSIGYRSEKIGERLKNEGFSLVYNLYGSIFEWTNRGYPIVDTKGRITEKLHTYNKKWSKWVDAKGVEKVW